MEPSSAPGASPVRVILLRPEQSRNVGAVVRAAANFGAESVHLVSAVSWSAEDDRQARVASAGAWDLIGGVEVHESLSGALAGCSILAGTSARPRRHAGEPLTPAAFFTGPARSSPGPIGMLFGPESQGLSAQELSQCHLRIRIPTRDEFPSLNLAQAVLLVLYETSRSRDLATTAMEAQRSQSPTADLAAQEALLARWAGSLRERGDAASGDSTDRVIAQMRRLLQRAQPSAGDLAMLDNLLRRLRNP